MKNLNETLQDLRVGTTSAAEAMDACLQAAAGPRCDGAWIETDFETARVAAAQAEPLAALPLGGLAVSVKDLFDVRGQRTRAGSRALEDRPAAARDCIAVERLRRAGGIIIGRTNMTEFAYSGVGINPHFGTPASAASRETPLIPGGSSSGAAVSVATGACFAGLGSDTGGSLRIPAALNGIVGFKCTTGLVPTDGTIPLSSTLDTVGALTRSVEDALRVHQVLSGRPVVRSTAPLSTYRMAVVRDPFLTALDPAVARAFDRALHRLSLEGARVEFIALDEMADLDTLNANGGFSAAESLAWHRALLGTHGHLYDPRVRARIERGRAISGADYVDLLQLRRRWIHAVQARISSFDACLAPTVPLLPCPIADVAPGADRDEAFFATNARLLRNTAIVNLLDGCAISIPCHATGELPVGLMIWQAGGRDDGVLNAALLAEAALAHG